MQNFVVVLEIASLFIPFVCIFYDCPCLLKDCPCMLKAPAGHQRLIGSIATKLFILFQGESM